jgi:dihydropteroate synthase
MKDKCNEIRTVNGSDSDQFNRVVTTPRSNFWQTSQRKIPLTKTLVMAILNVTPDSFSDGGKYNSLDSALKQTEKFIAEGADIIDIGGESTRPNADKISVDEEKQRVLPIIEAIKKRFDIPISIDTSKSEIAETAVNCGAEIINDISGLKFDEQIGDVATKNKTGLILMHLRGSFETMHKLEPVENIFDEVSSGFRESIAKAISYGVNKNQIALDIGIGFSKTYEQNLELLAKLDVLCKEFAEFPLLVGTSRKSFIGKILGNVPPSERLQGSLATVSLAVWHGAKIVRVHDVRETVETIKVIEAVFSQV